MSEIVNQGELDEAVAHDDYRKIYEAREKIVAALDEISNRGVERGRAKVSAFYAAVGIEYHNAAKCAELECVGRSVPYSVSTACPNVGVRFLKDRIALVWIPDIETSNYPILIVHGDGNGTLGYKDKVMRVIAEMAYGAGISGGESPAVTLAGDHGGEIQRNRALLYRKIRRILCQQLDLYFATHTKVTEDLIAASSPAEAERLLRDTYELEGDVTVTKVSREQAVKRYSLGDRPLPPENWRNRAKPLTVLDLVGEPGD